MTTQTYDNKPKLPAGLKLDEDNGVPALPSGLVLDDVKKKESEPESSRGVSALSVAGAASPTGTEETPQSTSVLPLDVEGIFSFDSVRKKSTSLPSNLPKADKQIRGVLTKVHFGDVKAEDLSSLYNTDYSRETAKRIVKEYAPEVSEEQMGSGLSLELAAKNINTKNRINFVTAETQGVGQLDSAINNSILNLKSPTKQNAGQVTGYINELRNELNVDDYNDNNKVASLISKVQKLQQVEQRNYLGGESRTESLNQTTSLLNELNNRLNYNISKTGITPTINQLGEQIDQAVIGKVMQAERGTSDFDVSNDEEKSNHFKLGMTAIEKTDPVLFKNVVNTISQLQKVDDTDFTTISRIGQDISNTMKFRGGAYNPELIGKETKFDYSTFGQKVAEASAAIGEWAKSKGYKNVNEFPERVIRQGAKETGVDNPEIVNTLVSNEKLLLYDAIPKSGWVDDIKAGIMQPLVGINSTLNSWSESPAETYMRSKAFDSNIGAQKVPNEKGEYSDILPSERERFTTDMFRGLGQFIPQVLLTKGVGAGIRAGVGAAGIPLAAGQARNVADFGGTAISTFLQSYGPAYEEHLQKTGDADTAALIGTIDGISSSAFELLLPDVRIADKAFSGLKQGLSNSLIGLVKKGGDPAELMQKARPFVQKFFTNATGTLVQENLEELGTQYVDFVTESIFDPESAKDRNLNKELWDTFKATSAAMILPSVLGAGGQSFQKDFTTKTLHSSAINFDSYKESLQKTLDKGYIDQNEFNAAVKLISTHKESIAQAPEQNINGTPVDKQTQLDYAYEDTKIKVYKEKAAQSEGVAKEMWENKIQQSEGIQREILMPKVVEETTPIVTETIDETIELTPDENNIYEQAYKWGGLGIKETIGDVPTKEGISFLQEQSLDVPNSLNDQLNKNELLTVGIIASNTKENIEQSITRYENELKQEGLSADRIEEIDKHLSLLDKGLKRQEFVDPVESVVPSALEDVQNKKAEIDSYKNEIDSFDDAYNDLADKVNAEDRRIGQQKSKNELELDSLNEKINIIRDKRDKAEKELQELESIVAKQQTTNEGVVPSALKEGNDVVPSSDIQSPLVKEDTISVSELLDKPVTRNGQRGTLFQDGQTVIFKPERTNREYELGNVNEISDASIKEFGLEQEQSVVDVNDAGDISVRSTVYKNNYSDPTQAINRNEAGDVVSVTLDTEDGKKRTFRGNIAEDIAYQISLKEITKDNETATRFEQFVESDEDSRQAIVSVENEVVVETEAVANNEEVQRVPIERQQIGTPQQINTQNEIQQPTTSAKPTAVNAPANAENAPAGQTRNTPATPSQPVQNGPQKPSVKSLTHELRTLLGNDDTNKDISGSVSGPIVKAKEAQRILDALSKKYGINGVLEDLGLLGPKGQFNPRTMQIQINRFSTLDKEGKLTASLEGTGNLSRRTIFHEYLHPFVQLLEKNNKDLYNSILKEATDANENNPFADISHYSESQYGEELVVRYLDRLSDSDNPTSIFNRFFDWVSNFLFNKKKNSKADIVKLSKDTTVGELYDVFKNYGNIKEDLVTQESSQSSIDKLRKEIGEYENILNSDRLDENSKEYLEKEILPKLRNDLKSLETVPSVALAGDANPKNRISFKDLGITAYDTIEQAIDKLIAYGGPFTDIFKAIKTDANFKNIKLQLVDSRSGLENNESGLYYPVGYGEGMDGTLQIANKDNVYYTAAHELMHFLTLDSATANEIKNTPSYQALTDMYNYIADKKGKPVAIAGGATLESYGLTNEKEFMAELLINPSFRNYVSDVFAQNKDDIFKTSKAVRDSKVNSIGDIIYNFFKDVFDKLFSSPQSEISFDEKQSVVDNAASLATQLFFGGENGVVGQTDSGQGSTVVGMGSANQRVAALAFPSTNNNDKINSFVKSALDRGATEIDIKQALINNGISETDAQNIIDNSKLLSDPETIGITHEQTIQIEKELGFSEYEKSPETIEQWDAEADSRIRAGYNIEDLLSRMSLGEQPDKIEQRIISKYVATLKAKIEQDPSDANLSEMKRVLQLSDIAGGREVGKSLVARKGLRPVDNSLAGFFIREMEELEVEVLTPTQKENIQKEYDEIKKANDALQSKVTKLQEQNSKLNAGEVVANQKTKRIKTKKTKQDFIEERKTIADNIREKLRKARGETSATIVPYAKELFAIAPDVARLMKSLVEEGIVNLGEVVNNIHSILKDEIQGITPKDVQDIIAGEYAMPKKTKNQLSAKLMDLRTEARLIGRLQDLENGIEPKSEAKRVNRNREITALRQQIKENDLTKLSEAKVRTQKQIESIEKQLDEGNYQQPEKKKPIQLDSEGKRLQNKLIKLKQDREIRILKDRYAQRSRYEKARDKVLEVLNVPRSIMASMDFSAPLRQGIVASIAHPRTAALAGLEMFKSAFSQNNFDKWFYELQNDPRYEMMKDTKLGIADPHSPFLTAKEEVYMNNLAEKIPIVGKLIKGSERAYVQYLNKMRVDLFNRFADRYEEQGKTYENNKELYDKMAGYINNQTGRGGLGKYEDYAPILNSLLFSPRLMAARINLLNPYYFYKLPPSLKAMYTKDMLKFIGLGLSILALAQYSTEDDDEDKLTVEWDARSSDFAKIRQGNTRWDIWGGFQPYIRVMAQMLTGERKSTSKGKIYELDGKGAFGSDRADVLKTFVRGKLSPVPSIAVNFLDGRTIVGEEVTIESQMKNNLLPLLYPSIEEAVKDKGIKGVFTVGVPSIFGVGTQTFDNSKKK
jgi:hypothetical protein